MDSYARKAEEERKRKEGLNPCCSGQWSRTANKIEGVANSSNVLILIVVDNGLVQLFLQAFELMLKILILIVVEDGLVLERFGLSSVSKSSLNPYYSGRWSRTMHDWRKFAWKKGS